MIIDAKTVAVTSMVIAVAIYWGLGIVRKFALQIAQGAHSLLYFFHRTTSPHLWIYFFLRTTHIFTLNWNKRKPLGNDETGRHYGH